MRGLAKAALIAIAIMVGALTSAPAQQTAPNVRVPPVTTRTITPLGWYALGSIGCAAVSPMIATVILGRELTLAEAYHTTLGCMLGPVGWLLADANSRQRLQSPAPNSRNHLASQRRMLGVDAISTFHPRVKRVLRTMRC